MAGDWNALALGWRTHLMFARFDGSVAWRGDHWCVRTPRCPTFWWGNFLLYERVPQEGDAAAWTAAFEAEIAQGQPPSTHCCFGIDGPADFELPRDFAAAGFTKSRATVLTLRREWLEPTRPPLPEGVRVRAAALPARIPELVDLQVATEQGGFGPDAVYRPFRERQMQRYAAMQDAGLGHWFAAFAQTPEGERPVADCGLFRERRAPGGIARFQSIGTHPDWRRQGIARAMLHAVCRHAFEVMKDETLVIAADPDYVALALYESLGFERMRDLAMIERRPGGAGSGLTGHLPPAAMPSLDSSRSLRPEDVAAG